MPTSHSVSHSITKQESRAILLHTSFTESLLALSTTGLGLCYSFHLLYSKLPEMFWMDTKMAIATDPL